MEKINYFSADYRDGLVTMAGKTYPAGTFATHLLNQYYENDTVARISVFTVKNWHLQDTLEKGYVDPDLFEEAGEELLLRFRALPWLKPFDRLDLESEKIRIKNLFTKDKAEIIMDYYHRKAKVHMMPWDMAYLDHVPEEYDKYFFKYASGLADEALRTLKFYESIGNDATVAFKNFREFTKRLDDAKRLDEANLLPIAMEIFERPYFPVNVEYVSVKKTAKSKSVTLAKRMYFDNYYSFIVTDFFEGLHYGHYPRRCPICKKYFLMESARRQTYCNGYSPYEINGKKITCKKYAARINRKELAENDPVNAIYKNCCSAIRVKYSRGEITEEIKKIACEIAKENYQTAKFDDNYANNQYIIDMKANDICEKAKEKQISL
ncbi:MAG: hypothetical protein IJM98_04345 [Oscillospiraceae bacterium]|nr:hypothetical protein [Oscillospiraceae bacterium]